MGIADYFGHFAPFQPKGRSVLGFDRMFRERAFDWAFVVAFCAHVLSIAAVGLCRRGHTERSLEVAPYAVVAALDVELIPLEPQTTTASDPTVENRASDPTVERRASDDRAPSRTELEWRPSVGTMAPTSPHAEVAAPNARDSHTDVAMADEALLHTDVAATDQTHSSPSEASGEPHTTKDEGERALGNPRPERTLSRSQLGLEPGNYSAVMPGESPVKAEMQSRLAASRRLERSIRQDGAERAAEIGLGEEGPILSKLEQLALGSSVDLTGKTSIAVRVMPTGVVEFELIGTSADRAAWNRLLAKAEKDLTKRVKLPKDSKGIDLEILIESRVQMPSGTDPGVNLNLFGLPLAKGEGKRSTRVDILSSLPKLKVDESAAARNEPYLKQRLELDVARSGFDLSDLSGKRTRMVRARVVRRRVL